MLDCKVLKRWRKLFLQQFPLIDEWMNTPILSGLQGGEAAGVSS